MSRYDIFIVNIDDKMRLQYYLAPFIYNSTRKLEYEGTSSKTRRIEIFETNTNYQYSKIPKRQHEVGWYQGVHDLETSTSLPTNYNNLIINSTCFKISYLETRQWLTGSSLF